MRVLILHNIINPQVLPYFEGLAQEPDMDVTVWFLAERTSTRLWDTGVSGSYKWELLPGFQWEIQMEEKIALQWNPSLAWRIRREKFDVVVLFSGWDAPSFWLAAVMCRAFGIPMVLRSGSVPGSSAYPGGQMRSAFWRRRFSRTLVRRIVSSAAACLAYGTRSGRYLAELGAPLKRIFRVWNTVDVEQLTHAFNGRRPGRDALRAHLGVGSGEVLALYVGRFQPVKYLDSLIEAHKLARERNPRLALGLVGYGPCEAQLRSLAGRSGGVHFYGPAGPDALPDYYAAADLFVLPSADIWGLVVNEAMAFGLPVVAADSAGCTEDLVLPGQNGIVYPSRQVEPLAEALCTLAEDEALRRRMGAASVAHIQNFTYRRAISELAAAVRLAYARPGLEAEAA